jgi:uncharacterized heparinase superfamily protein
MMLFRIPIWAWPSLVRYSLARRFAVARRPSTPDLSDADLDFFLGGTDSVQTQLANPAFRFFASTDFETPDPDLLDSILAHRLTLLGHPVNIGSPIEWRRDFNTGYQWPCDPSARLPLTTLQGDVKVPWELSRFQHGVALALGYATTGDWRYAAEWAAQFSAWRADNPLEHGPNWGNAMEAALRAANWIAAFHFLQPALDSATQESVLKALIQHGRFIFNHLETYWPPTNHLLSNLCGLIWLGLFLQPDSKNRPASPEPHRWLEYGLRELPRQLQFQIRPDGASYEASTAYHCFVTEMVSSTVKLCELNSVFVPPTLKQTVTKMESVVAALRKPAGSLPLFGDEDGGQFLWRRSSGAGPAPESGWSAFPHAGWYVYRDHDEYLAVTAGDNGQAGWGGHAHNDALSFEYALGSRTFLVDPGTYTYTADPEARNLFRSTAYHNTLRIDGQEISRMPPGELFRLQNDVKANCQLQNGIWLGEHHGYARLGVAHMRRIEKTETGWRIVDTVRGSGDHALEWFFHFAPDCPVKIAGLRCWTEFPAGANLSLTSDFESLNASLQSGWVSPTYGVRLPAPIVCYTVRIQLPLEVEFIITRL